jgi:hypothetical protein
MMLPFSWTYLVVPSSRVGHRTAAPRRERHPDLLGQPIRLDLVAELAHDVGGRADERDPEPSHSSANLAFADGGRCMAAISARLGGWRTTSAGSGTSVSCRGRGSPAAGHVLRWHDLSHCRVPSARREFRYDGRSLLDVLMEVQESERRPAQVTTDGAVVFEDRTSRYDSRANCERDHSGQVRAAGADAAGAGHQRQRSV